MFRVLLTALKTSSYPAAADTASTPVQTPLPAALCAADFSIPGGGATAGESAAWAMPSSWTFDRQDLESCWPCLLQLAVLAAASSQLLIPNPASAAAASMPRRSGRTVAADGCCVGVYGVHLCGSLGRATKHACKRATPVYGWSQCFRNVEW